MTPEQEAIQKADSEQRLKEKLDDYNNELAGNDVGRIQRFGFDQSRKAVDQKEKRKKSTLEQMMLDEAYRDAWTGAINALNQAEESIYEALVNASDKLSLARKHHQELLENAALTDSGIKVFRDKENNAYTENGELVSGEVAASAQWHSGATTWEEYTDSNEQIAIAQEGYNAINTKSDRLVEIREELTDEDNPLSIDRINELKQDALDLQESLHNKVKQETNLEQSHKPVVAPDLSFSF